MITIRMLKLLSYRPTTQYLFISIYFVNIPHDYLILWFIPDHQRIIRVFELTWLRYQVSNLIVESLLFIGLLLFEWSSWRRIKMNIYWYFCSKLFCNSEYLFSIVRASEVYVLCYFCPCFSTVCFWLLTLSIGLRMPITSVHLPASDSGLAVVSSTPLIVSLLIKSSSSLSIFFSMTCCCCAFYFYLLFNFIYRTSEANAQFNHTRK